MAVSLQETSKLPLDDIAADVSTWIFLMGLQMLLRSVEGSSQTPDLGVHGTLPLQRTRGHSRCEPLVLTACLHCAAHLRTSFWWRSSGFSLLSVLLPAVVACCF